MSKENGQVSRREFISKSAAGFAALGTGGMVIDTAGIKPYRRQIIRDRIITRTLGKTGIEVPIIGFGIMNTNDPGLIAQSYNEGVRLYDTALRYHNEDMVGDAIEKLGIRDEIILETKVPVPDYQKPGSMSSKQMHDKFLEDFEGCMKRLKTDYLDILFFHNIKFMKDMHDEGLKEALHTIKESGRVRHIGVSTHTIHEEVLEEAVKQSDLYSVAQISFSYMYSIISRFKPRFEAISAAIKHAADNNIGIIAMKTQALGGQIAEAGQKHHTAMLKWVLKNENITCAIPGYTNIDQMKEDFSVAYDLQYDEEERDSLRIYEEKYGDSAPESCSSFCFQCRECRPSCPNGVDVPTLMRTHMYAAGYSNFLQAREAMKEIPERQGIEVCADCDTCSARCANHSVDIAGKIRDLKLIYC